MKHLLLFFLAITLFACTDTSLEEIRQIKVGMKKAEVIKLLGEPSDVDVRDTGETWWYKYRMGARFNWQLLYFTDSTLTSF